MERIIVSLDVETTGLQVGTDEIIEVAAVQFRGDEVLGTFTQLVCPRQSVPLKITRLTGITSAALEAAPRFVEIAPDFARFIKNYPIIGHSVSFDLNMLRQQGMNFAQEVYDTYELATLLMPQAATYRLSAIAERLGIAHPADHRALNDAQVCRQVFLHLVQRIHTLDLRELTEINRLTARMHWSPRELFAEAMREKARSVFVEAAAPSPPPLVLTSQAVSVEVPLKPTGDARPLNADDVTHFFAPDGPMGRIFHGYEQRAPQVDMARAVVDAFNQSETQIVEAGTGVGKSLAYLVPAALFALRRGERVVVSTNTINLQDQLFFKDIPDLQRMLGDAASPKNAPLHAALLKGRSNYLCLRRYKETRRSDTLQPEEVQALLKVYFWLPTTQSGDRAELVFHEREQFAWSRINVTPETCTGPRCPEFRECFFFRARRRAEAAHLVVVNHALLIADLATEALVLPAYAHVVIDEAHNLEDVATDQLSFAVDQAALLKFCDDLYNEGGARMVSGVLSELRTVMGEAAVEEVILAKVLKIVDEIHPALARARQVIYDCFNLLMSVVQHELSGGQYDPRLRLTRGVRAKPDWREVETVWSNLNQSLTVIGEGLGKLVTILKDLEQADADAVAFVLLRIEWLYRQSTDIRIHVGHIIFGDEEHITWITHERTHDSLTLSAAPLSVAEILQTQLFAQKQTSVLASATLSIDGNFAFVRSRLGLEESAELQLESPFDYEQQSFLYIPNDIPEPNQHGYQRMVEEALVSLCKATGGRTLALFTANSALRQTYSAIQEPLEEDEIAVLGQGIDGSRRSILERFKEFPRTVLLGTSSFWEGVDVVGDALSVLVITKLPFSVPTDPIFAARSEQYGADAFNTFAVPQSILRFKQGFGRLIRSKEDRGIVVVLDRRLLSKKYGQQFLHSLPATRVRAGSVKQLPLLAARFLV